MILAVAAAAAAALLSLRDSHMAGEGAWVSEWLEENFVESVLSVHLHVDSRDQTQDTSKRLHPLSHLTGQKFFVIGVYLYQDSIAIQHKIISVNKITRKYLSN